MNKSQRIALGVGLTILVLALVGYFVVLPAVQVANYKKAAAAQHAQVNDKLVRVYDTFKRPAFTSTDTKPAADKLDIQVGRDAIADARSTLETNAPVLTDFHAFPLLSWNKQYQQATDTAAAEDKYIKQARSFLNDYRDLLDFSDKYVALGIEADEAGADLENIGSQPTPGAMAAMIDTTTAKFEKIAADEKALAAPDYLKPFQDKAIASTAKLVTSLGGLATATRELNVAKLASISEDVDKQVAAAEKDEQAFITSLQTESPIQRHITELRSLNTAITSGYAKL